MSSLETKRRRKQENLPAVPTYATDLHGKMVAIDTLVPYARNARLHDAVQITQIADSIKEWGWTIPILADDKGIVAGHGRVLAAKQLYEAGHTIKLPNGEQIRSGTVPVIDCTGWDEQQRNAYIIADNKIALNAKWDMETLAAELESMGDYKAALAGFSPDEFASILGMKDAPESFNAFDETIPTEHTCPRCGYSFSGGKGAQTKDEKEEE